MPRFGLRTGAIFGRHCPPVRSTKWPEQGTARLYSVQSGERFARSSCGRGCRPPVRSAFAPGPARQARRGWRRSLGRGEAWHTGQRFALPPGPGKAGGSPPISGEQALGPRTREPSSWCVGNTTSSIIILNYVIFCIIVLLLFFY